MLAGAIGTAGACVLEALRNEEIDPETKGEVLDELHARREVGAMMIGEALLSLIEIRKALAKALAKS